MKKLKDVHNNILERFLGLLHRINFRATLYIYIYIKCIKHILPASSLNAGLTGLIHSETSAKPAEGRSSLPLASLSPLQPYSCFPESILAASEGSIKNLG